MRIELLVSAIVMASSGMLVGCSGASPLLHGSQAAHVVNTTDDDDATDSPLKLVGERLFREIRFSQYFFTQSQGKLNLPPVHGDAVVDVLETLTGSIPHPYKGQAISCAACHFVDQLTGVPGGGSRAYTDFTRRSPIPDRKDGVFSTPRNAPIMVGSSTSTTNFLHHDGEFASPEDLIRASYFGRNLGWLPGEESAAAAHMANLIRHDDGSFPTETDLKNLSYPHLLAGDSTIPSRFLVPAEYRINVATASDAEIVTAVINLVAGYMRSLDFKRDANGNNNGSPFDLFLHKNSLPLAPNSGEDPRDYSARLAKMAAAMPHPVFVSDQDKKFKLHSQGFVFGPTELKGFQIFAGRGQCTRCHAAPDFTDHLFHNTGSSQDEYDHLHGTGAFARLDVPNVAARLAQADIYLPTSDQHPSALGVFRSAPSASDPRRADLGVWNVLFNPDMPHPQLRLRAAVCAALNLTACDQMNDDELLSKSIGMIKTPSVRDLGQTAPYLHTGQMDTIEDVLNFYIRIVSLAQEGQVRNADPLLAHIQISSDDVTPIASFLRSLNEDYD